MQIIDNVNQLLGDDLKQVMNRGSKVRLAASTFSIYAFEALRKELESLDELQFIFTAPTFVAAEATDKIRKERREFFIPQAQRESSLLSGSDAVPGWDVWQLPNRDNRFIAELRAEYFDRLIDGSVS